jgi:hypothetical protein
MPETALVVPSNLSHNVPALIKGAKNHLTELATLYLVTEVVGQPPATLDAKRRDLQHFLAFYHQLYSHDRVLYPAGGCTRVDMSGDQWGSRSSITVSKLRRVSMKPNTRISSSVTA